MNTDVKRQAPLHADDASLGRSQAIFVTVGVMIILGGLWLLYSGSGPYHPAEAQVQVYTDS